MHKWRRAFEIGPSLSKCSRSCQMFRPICSLPPHIHTHIASAPMSSSQHEAFLLPCTLIMANDACRMSVAQLEALLFASSQAQQALSRTSHASNQQLRRARFTRGFSPLCLTATREEIRACSLISGRGAKRASVSFSA